MATGRDSIGTFYVEGGKGYRSVQKGAWSMLEATLPFQEKLGSKGVWLPLHFPPAKEDESAYYCEVPLLPLMVYPYEWPFPLWKEAALTTLFIQREALSNGFWLRDATPFNITLYRGKMCHFDQLSLGYYPEGSPWPAYMEFVKSFLAPLLLMSYRDRRLGNLIQLYPAGLPLDLVWKLLPLKGRWSILSLLHLYPHKFRILPGRRQKAINVPKKKLFALVESLYVGIESLRPCYGDSPWEGYAQELCPYVPEARQKKEATVQAWIQRLSAVKWALDLGAHEGGYTRILAPIAQEGIVALESDPLAIDRLWNTLSLRYKHLYPIWADFSHPSPEIGWNSAFPSLFARLQDRFDLVLALALIHHLRYKNLMPYAVQLQLMASFLKPGGYLIIEFIPVGDPQIKYLHSQPEIFPDHRYEVFEALLKRYFVVEERVVLEPMGRILHLARKI